MTSKPSQRCAPAGDRLAELAELFPEAFNDGHLDLDAFAAAAGVTDTAPAEPYGLTWPGKAAAAAQAQLPAATGLRLDLDASSDAERTRNALVVGDNLETLRLISGAYDGAVKLIYIDSPYNTGDDRVYADNSVESIAEYRTRTGGVDPGDAPDGMGGRYHSKWLSMMYPRLILARTLLRRDGLFFASIGVEELGTLRMLCDSVFGEENLVSVASWRRRHNQPNDRTTVVAQVAEFVLIYARDLAHIRSELSEGRRPVYGVPLSEKRTAAYKNPDKDPRGPWDSKPWKAGTGQGGSRYTITAPDGRVLDEVWQGSAETYRQLTAENRIYWPSNGAGMPRKKIFLSERRYGAAPPNFWNHDEWGSNQEATTELAALFDGTKQVFENPKPVRLIQRIVALATRDDDLVVDFFAGSGTTAHAVWEQNRADGHRRRVLLVQLPEQVPARHVARTRFGHDTVDQITVDRLARAADAIGTGDTGLRVFHLGTVAPPDDGESGDTNGVGRDSEDIETYVWEVALRHGFQLDAAVTIHDDATAELRGAAADAERIGVIHAATAELAQQLASSFADASAVYVRAAGCDDATLESLVEHLGDRLRVL